METEKENRSVRFTIRLTESEARQLRIDEGGSLFFLTGIARDYNNVPVEFFKSVARPDMVRFSSILRKYRTESERR